MASLFDQKLQSLKGVGAKRAQLFEKLEDVGLQREGENIALTCYEILASKSEVEQAQLLQVLLAVEEYKRV